MVNAKMTKKKRLKDEFKEFRHHDKSAYTTIKIPLRSLLLNHKVVQPVLNHLVFDMNDLVIHTYPDPEIPESRFIVYAFNRRFVPV